MDELHAVALEEIALEGKRGEAMTAGCLAMPLLQPAAAAAARNGAQACCRSLAAADSLLAGAEIVAAWALHHHASSGQLCIQPCA
jgi:hypothetical protein